MKATRDVWTLVERLQSLMISLDSTYSGDIAEAFRIVRSQVPHHDDLPRVERFLDLLWKDTFPGSKGIDSWRQHAKDEV